MAQKYFGINLEALVTASDDELSVYADRAKEMDRLLSVLPILEEHFTTLIEGQIVYEEFNKRVMKQATAAGKKIDSAIVETFLSNRDYNLHASEMSQKVNHGMQKQDTEHRNALNLGQSDFAATLSIVAMKYAAKQRVIGQKLPIAQKQMELDEAARQVDRDRQELLKFGNRGKQGNGVGWFRRLWGS